MALSFDVSPADAALIGQLAERAVQMERRLDNRRPSALLDWRMDFTACHASGNPLRLADLLAADDFNFAHDAFGIANHLDRSTGELTSLFSPRFSAPLSEQAAA